MTLILQEISRLRLWQVNEQPGTYFWHGHSGNEKVDGFTGPLIVRPAGPEALTYDEERVLFLSDNYHTSATALTFPLNRYFTHAILPLSSSRDCLCRMLCTAVSRIGISFVKLCQHAVFIDRPFDAKKQTNETGGWDWVRSRSLMVQAGNYPGLLMFMHALHGVADPDVGIPSAGGSASVNHTEQPRLLWGLRSAGRDQHSGSSQVQCNHTMGPSRAIQISPLFCQHQSW